MKTIAISIFLCCLAALQISAQDSMVIINQKVITLKEVVVRSNMDVPSFIRRIQLDTSFYRAFKNLHEISYTALNDVRMLDKKGELKASLQSKTQQDFSNGCRRMAVLEEQSSGDIKTPGGDWNYYTAEMYAALFFTQGEVCGENTSVKASELSLHDKHGLEKHKEQLKMMFFNPGRRIPGIPFIGDKINIYEEPNSSYYDFELDIQPYHGQNCYVFTISAKKDLSGFEKDKVVFNSITTWFDQQKMSIVARRYDLSYDAAVYDFDVQMEVEISPLEDIWLPSLIRYTGNWKLAFKKRERGVFTATIFNAKK
ncbi:hypothetical protein [Flavihumibacter profundi]|uniref:hypothetical protein n=1 Tax=Flavihumibacter profundi TaxID=2716883 RepID=UPI001CC6E7D5|nr:hypothetical protein [Flavihumibacter profundi]MBZ5856532.1 hypothetical protein [Flavihumibacter profundi]